MKLILKDVGIIHNADIKLNGLTVIAGENSSGKSTVGKTLYTLIKSLNHFNIDKTQLILSWLKSTIKDLSFFIMQETNLDADIRTNLDSCLREISKLEYFNENKNLTDSFIHDKLQEIFANLILQICKLLDTLCTAQIHEHQNKPITQKSHSLEKNFLKIAKYYADSNLEYPDSTKLSKLIHKREKSLSDDCPKIIHSSALNSIFQNCIRIHSELASKDIDISTVESYMLNKIHNEFRSGLFNDTIKSNGIINLIDDSKNILDINLLQEKIKINSYPDHFYFTDATYIESPIMLYFNQYEISDSSNLPNHIEDLLKKLSSKNTKDQTLIYKNTIIDNIIGGHFHFSDTQNQFVFENSDSKELSITNIATGTKSLGILQLLQQNGWLLKDNIIIIDEPEIHLHPKWQLEYCKIISLLVQHGKRFVITTHSPYIVQALNVYSKKCNISENVNFYLTNEISNVIEITETTNRLSAIYEKLTAPLRELL